MLKQGYVLVAASKFPPRSLVKFFCRYISPCQMTILGLFFGCLAGVSIPFFPPVVPLVIVLVSVMCDFLDGAMARYSRKTSKLGAALDKMSDAIVELALLLGIAFVDPEQRMWGLVVVVSYIATYNLFFVVVGYKLFKIPLNTFTFSHGIVGRAELLLLIGFFAFFPQWFAQLMIVTITLGVIIFVQTAIKLASLVLRDRKHLV